MEARIWKLEQEEVGGSSVLKKGCYPKPWGESERVEKVWKGRKDCLLDIADNLGGRTKDQHDTVKPGGGMTR